MPDVVQNFRRFLSIETSQKASPAGALARVSEPEEGRDEQGRSGRQAADLPYGVQRQIHKAVLFPVVCHGSTDRKLRRELFPVGF